MKLFIKLDNSGSIIGHDWLHLNPDLPNDPNYKECKFNEPKDIFDIERNGYKYKIINNEYILLNDFEFENHPLKILGKIKKKLIKLKEKEEGKRHKADWEKVKLGLIDIDEINEVQKRIDDLDKE